MQLRVLIFDDEQTIRMLMTRYMERRGYDVTSYGEPTHYQCSCGGGHLCADVILCDISMPGMSGMEFLEQLSATDCKVPHFALMSGNCSPQNEERARELGSHVFHKPFRFAEIDRWLDECEASQFPSRRENSGSARVPGFLGHKGHSGWAQRVS